MKILILALMLTGCANSGITAKDLLGAIVAIKASGGGYNYQQAMRDHQNDFNNMQTQQAMQRQLQMNEQQNFQNNFNSMVQQQNMQQQQNENQMMNNYLKYKLLSK